MLNQTLGAQAQIAYDAAVNSSRPDWRAVAELFRAAMQAERPKRTATGNGELVDYNVDRVKLLCRSPRIAVRFMDGEAVFTHVPSAPGTTPWLGRPGGAPAADHRSPQCSGFGERLANTPYLAELAIERVALAGRSAGRARGRGAPLARA